MMNEFQRRILAEAAKFGGTVTSKNEQMARAINEAPLFATGGGGAMFGYSKQQFEAKMRQLIQKMGFEKGINKMEVSDKKMMLYFANAAKARDFIITFNGLTKRQATGSPASINTSFDKVKAPAGTNAIVTVDFSMLKTEGLDKESHLFLMLESLHEEYINEGAVKAAMEDWVEGLPKAVVAEIGRKYGAKLKAAEMKGLSKTDPVRKELKQLLDKNKVAPAMGDKSRESDIAALEMMFNTFHGESVEVNEENLNIGTYGFRLDRDSGKFVLYQLSYSQGSVRFPDGRKGTVIGRYATRDEAIAAAKRNAGVKEEVDIEEAKVKYLTGPGKRDSKRIIGIYTMSGKWVKDMNSEREAATFVNKSWGESVEMHIEEVTGNTRLEESVTGGFAKIFLLSRTKNRIRGNEKWYTVVFSRDTKDANTILATSEAGTKKISLKEFVEWCDKFPNASRNDKYHFAHDYSDGGYDYEWFIGPYWTNKFIGVSEEGSYIWLDNGLYPKAYPHPAWLKKVKQLAMGGVGESVEEDGEELTEAQQVIGKYRFTSFTEGSLKGWLISVQSKGEVGFIEEPAKKNTRTSIAPHKVFFNTKQQGNPKLVLTAFPDSTTRFVGDKEVRFAPRQLLKAVAMWMDKHGMSMVESFDISEVWWKGTDSLTKTDADGLLDDLESAYKKGGLNGTMKVPNGDSGLVWEMIDGLKDFLRGEPKNMVAYVLKGVKDFLKPEDRNNSKIKAVFESFTEAYAPLDTKGIVGAFTEATYKKRFEYRNSTDSWGKSHGLPHEVCVSYGGDRKEQWRSANVKGTVCYIAVDEGADGKPVMEKWAIRNHVKYVKAESVEIDVTEAKSVPSENDLRTWYKATGAVPPFEGAVPSYKNLKNMYTRAKAQQGKAWEIWKKLVDKGTVSEVAEIEGEVIEEQDRVAVQGSKMVYVGQRLRALQSKSMMSGSVVKGEVYKVATNAQGRVDLVHQSIGYRTSVRNVDATTIEALIKDRVLT